MVRGGVGRAERRAGDTELIVESLAGGTTTRPDSDLADHVRRPVQFLSILIFVLAALAWAPANAKYASIVINADTGAVYHEINADERKFPASLTKLMTLYLLFEAVENKRIRWDTQFTASRQAALQPATRLGLAPGHKITAKEATLALIIHSANDVATIVAEELGGTEEKFALQMTAKARQLGMTRTTFRNASGLPHSGQQSTARDMALLAQAILDRFPQHYSLFSETSFSYGGRVYKTHNRVVLGYDGADGLKTGYTHASGFNLVTSAVRDNHRLIGVVFGGNTSRSRDQHMESLLDRAFADARQDGPLVAKNTARPSKMPAVPVASVSTEGRAEPAPADGDRGDWGIQVGAFQTKEPARTAARKVMQKYSKLLDGGQIVVAPLPKSKGKVLYRARIMGIEKGSAQQACKLLKRAKQVCMELKEPAPQELAEG